MEFEIAKRQRLLKELRIEYLKRHITEKEYRKRALAIQAELKELGERVK